MKFQERPKLFSLKPQKRNEQKKKIKVLERVVTKIKRYKLTKR